MYLQFMKKRGSIVSRLRRANKKEEKKSGKEHARKRNREHIICI